MLNLSLGGALVAASRKLAMGAKVHITFSVPTVEQPIDVGATVRWSDGSRRPASSSTVCERVDVWALNKYFEQLQS